MRKKTVEDQFIEQLNRLENLITMLGRNIVGSSRAVYAPTTPARRGRGRPPKALANIARRPDANERKDPIKAFGVLATSQRAKALTLLRDRPGEYSSLAEMAEHIYGVSTRQNRINANQHLICLRRIAEDNDLPWQIVSKNGEYTLKKKRRAAG